MKSVSMRRRGAGPNVPDQVLGLTATPISSSQVNLTWNPAATAQSYTIRRDGQQLVNQLSATTYSDAPLAASTTYGYKVSAVNPFGEGAPSALVTATTSPGGNVFPPSPPAITNLTATGTADPTTTLRATHTLTLATDHYAVQRRVTGTIPWTRLPALNHTGASIDITGNSPGQSVDVQIAACDATESVVLWSLTATASTQAATIPPGTLGFPVTGIWAAQPSTNTAYLQGLAKYNFVEGVYNMAQQVAIPAATNMASIKSFAAAAGNPWCKILQYNIINEWWPSTGSAGFFNNALLALLNATPLWWLTSTWPTLTQVTSQDNDNRKATNISDTTQVVNVATVGSVTGPGNVNYVQANVWLWLQQYVLGKAHALNASDPSVPANPNVDGMAIDNQEIGCPYVSGNWLNTSTFYSCSAGQLVPAVQGPTQHGYQQAIDMVRSVYPTVPDGSEFLILGNVDGYGLGAGAPYKTSIQGKYDLPMAEDPFGRYEQNQGATYSTMLASLAGMEVCLRPGLNHFMVGLMESMAFNGNVGPINFPTNQSSWTAAHWQAARYQFANLTMLRWVAMFSNPVSPTNIWFFDELLGGSPNVFQWLGQPIGARNLTPLADGTYQADFTNGSLRVNPKGNPVKTFNMPYSGHFLATAGFGDATYNTGAAFTTATTRTLQTRDAIFFKKS